MNWKPFFVTICFYLILLSDGKRHSRRKKERLIQNVDSTELSVVDTGLDVKEEKFYSSWSTWTRCNRKCKQKRRRYCRIRSECGTNILREERACFKDRCRDQSVKKEEILGDILTHRDGDDAPSSDFTIVYHVRQPFSNWTAWSPCSRECLTQRIKSCQMPDVCGQKILREYALCYNDNSSCERLKHNKINKRRKRKKSSTDLDPDGRPINPLAGLKCGVAPKAQGIQQMLRIIGGREAAKGSWPWQVTILNKYREPFCGGTLLNEGWVLTAAHCVRKRRLLVIAGEHDLMSNEGTEQESRVDEAFEHPGYNDTTINNDVALLRLKHPFNFNDDVQPACLPEPTDMLKIDTRAVIIGWGKKKNTAIYGTDQLYQAEVPIVNLNQCRGNYLGYNITNRMLCAGFKQGRVDSCSGDSGGPLLYQKNSKWTVYGITSFGEGCGQRGKYGIYADVPKFVDWIRRKIARHS